VVIAVAEVALAVVAAMTQVAVSASATGQLPRQATTHDRWHRFVPSTDHALHMSVRNISVAAIEKHRRRPMHCLACVLCLSNLNVFG
jgi:hypothetical protein